LELSFDDRYAAHRLSLGPSHDGDGPLVSRHDHL
jgi:hypothetical protein